MSGWPNADNWDEERKTLPEAQQTQGVDFIIENISPAKKNATCIGSKFDHQMTQFALVAQLSTRWRHLH